MRPWLKIFLIGLALWVAAVIVTGLTLNPNLVPTVVLLGSFLVPVTFVFWAFARRDTGEIDAPLILNTFITGGVLGVLAASLLETYLLHPSPWMFLGVGLIEKVFACGPRFFRGYVGRERKRQHRDDDDADRE